MAKISTERLVAAARDLRLGGRWAAAADLLDAATTSDAEEAAQLALERAEVEADRAFWTQSDPDRDLLDRLASTYPGSDWRLAFLRLRVEYGEQLRRAADGSEPVPDRVQSLRERAAWLSAAAVDPDDRAFATFYSGLVEDVLAGDPTTAAGHYRAALDGAGDLTRSFALRHLGAHRNEAGDTEAARQLWCESTALRQRVGHVPGVLAQLALLRDSVSVGDVVSSWAGELGIGWLVDRA